MIVVPDFVADKVKVRPPFTGAAAALLVLLLMLLFVAAEVLVGAAAAAMIGVPLPPPFLLLTVLRVKGVEDELIGEDEEEGNIPNASARDGADSNDSLAAATAA